MRFIHTSDIHLDATFAEAGMPPGFGNRRRQGLRDVLQSIVTRAKEWPATAVLIAGDLFDCEHVSRDTISFLRGQFEDLRPIPVFIAPGNHDPYMRSSPYASEAWPANVYLFEETVWSSFELKHEPLTVHGFAFDGPDIPENPFGRIEVPEDGRIHVAVAHGSERGHQPAGKESYAPFLAQNAAAPGLHYLALGHFHSVTSITGDFDTVMHYSGAPEGHSFNEPGVHHYLEIEIAREDHAAPRIEVSAVPSSKSVYRSATIDCAGFENSSQLVEALRALTGDDGLQHIVRATLVGPCPPGFQAQIPAIYDSVAESFACLHLLDETQSAEDYAELAAEDTSLGVFVQRIGREIADVPDEDRRAMLLRAREIGLAAYRGRDVPVRGLESEGR